MIIPQLMKSQMLRPKKIVRGNVWPRTVSTAKDLLTGAFSNTKPMTQNTVNFLPRFMSNPYRNCELTRKDVRTIGQYELDYALGWILYQKTAGSCIASSNGYRSEEDNADDVGLARYDRYKFDYKIVPRAVVVRKSVLDATHCARECDFHRSTSTRGCQAFSYS